MYAVHIVHGYLMIKLMPVPQTQIQLYIYYRFCPFKVDKSNKNVIITILNQLNSFEAKMIANLFALKRKIIDMYRKERGIYMAHLSVEILSFKFSEVLSPEHCSIR